MKKFLIVANLNKDTNAGVANKVRDAIVKNIAKAELISFDIFDNKDAKLILKSAEGMEAIIVVGGDGTLIRTARATNRLNLPVIGVNTGHIGYLCEIDEERIDAAVLSLINDDFSIEDRMMLKGEVIRDGKVIADTNVLNDVVVHRGSCPDISDFTVYVNKSLLGEYSSDGIVISTATGSTAYNLSAGGPIARPESTMIIMTPLCPHTLSNRSVLFSRNDEIELLIKELRKPGEELRTVSFDGRDVINVKTGDIIRVTRAKQTTKIAKINQDSFLQVVNKKLVDGR